MKYRYLATPERSNVHFLRLMELHCTRPGCSRPLNVFPDLANSKTVKTVNQKFCTACGMPLILAGRYLAQRLLGKGGFGAAYLAIDRFSPALRTCVVKIFQPDGDLEAAQLELAQGLFEREAEALEQLGNAHPQIPDLLAFFSLEVPSLQPGKAQELFYLVQEYIDGQSLEEELEQNGPFPEQDVRTILLDVLGILQFVHDRQTIHRDIKPSNIMRDRRGKIYLLDFGAVKQVTQAAAKAKSSTGIYSPGYAPSEQMQGGEVYPSTDLYALGVTALVLLTDKDPADLYDSFSGAWNYQKDLQIDDGFAQVLEKMLQPTPRDRLQSAQAVRQAFQAYGGSKASGTTLQKPPAQSSPSVPPSPPAPSPAATPVPVQQLPPPAPSVSPVSASPPPAPTPRPAPVPAPKPSPVPAVAASPAPLKVQPPTPAPIQSSRQQSTRQPFSIAELVGHAAFTGSQAGIMGIAIASLLGTTLIGTGSWLLILIAVLLLQYFRVIEGVDLIIIAALSLLVLLIVRPLTSVLSHGLINAVLIIVIMSLVAVSITLFFQILFRLLRNLL